MAHENATPRPWHYSHGSRRILGALDDDRCHPQIAEGISKRISESDPRAAQFERDAALIVEAVNAYDTLQSGIEAAVSETNRVRAAYGTLRAENERLAEFARWVIAEAVFTGSELCGSIAQDKACELGLIVSTTYDPSKHGPHDAAEAGDEWFVFGPALSEAQP